MYLSLYCGLKYKPHEEEEGWLHQIPECVLVKCSTEAAEEIIGTTIWTFIAEYSSWDF